jgi:hypothetical protein
MVMILDSCHSGAISGPDFKPGPLGDGNFGQLSYDKGMRVLVAAQAEDMAFGTLSLIDRSLLTYSLTHQRNESEVFNLESWLNRAEIDVPLLFKKEVADDQQNLQVPVFFNFIKKK